MALSQCFTLVILLHACVGLAGCLSTPYYKPVAYTTEPNGAPIIANDSTTFKLSSDGTTSSIIVLDYGQDVEGYPTFQVSWKSGDTSVFEMTYSETQALLDSYMGDGPLALAAAMDTYRTNQYNITSHDRNTSYTNRLIQGAMRYQKLSLSSAGDLELSFVGLKPSTATSVKTPLSALPGSFICSDPVLNRIWEMGARTMQLNEFPAESLPEFWTITPDQGAFVDSLAPQPWAASDYASMLTAYELDFSVKPTKNGFGFSVLSDTIGSGIYIFVNMANSSISAHAGSTELSTPLASSTLPASAAVLNRWHTVHSTVNLTQVSVRMNGVSVLNFFQTSSFAGSFGLGASLGHSTYFMNVSLSVSGKQIYYSPLTNESTLDDFFLGTNPLPVSVDGSRRDRIAYAGDLDMTTSTAFASTYGHEYINGSIELLGSFQMLPGFFAPNAKVQQSPRTSGVEANITGLIGYSFSLVSAMAHYYEQTGDVNFRSHWAPRAARLFDWADSQTLSNGLLNISDSTFGGDWNHYDPSLSGVVSKLNLIYAYSLKQWLPFMAGAGLNATMYTTRLQSLQNAINANLWSDTLQAYYLSESHKDFFSQEANALALLSDTTDNHTANTVLSTLAHELYTPTGALAFSNASTESGWAQKISPYASGYHLKAAFHANDSTAAKHLLYSLWAPMSDPTHANYTGCAWEVLNPDGTPGIGDGTSMCHAWSSGPTADLSRYVLGVRPATPGFKEWRVVPQTLGLDWTRGEYPVPGGGKIQVNWSFDSEGLLRMTVTAPAGTKGTVYLSKPLRKDSSRNHVSGGRVLEDGSFAVQGGETFAFVQIEP